MNFCPGCHGSFSFATPVPAPEAERRREKRAAIDRMARFCGMLPAVYLGWDPFTDPADERELLTAVQERWGQAEAVMFEDAPDRKWAIFRHYIVRTLRERAGVPTGKSRDPFGLTLSHLAPGDIARAVDATLRQYPESA